MYLPKIIPEFHVQSDMIQVTPKPDYTEVTHWLGWHLESLL